MIDLNPVQTALRNAELRGRIAGLREAAEIVDYTVFEPSVVIRAAADKLEKQEPQ